MVSPVTGRVIRWNLFNGAAPFKYRLRVVTRIGGGTYSFPVSSAAETPSGPNQSFPASIPISAGQEVGLDLEGGAPLGVGEVGPGDSYTFFEPVPADGTTATGLELGPFPLGFNAEVLPAPTLSAVTPGKGSIRGGTAATIAGTDLTQVQAVSFGGVPAAGFTVDSEAQITAIAPPAEKPGAVPVSVTTVAGTATLDQGFGYEACVAPKLKGKKLKAAKRAIRKKGCRFGKLRKKKGVTAKRGRVVKQWPKPGTIKPPGARVSLKLG